MSLEQLMALARGLDKQVALPARPVPSMGAQPRSYQLSAQEWAELFPDSPILGQQPSPLPSAA